MPAVVPVQNLLSSSLLSKNIRIKIRTTVILPVVLYWRETFKKLGSIG